MRRNCAGKLTRSVKMTRMAVTRYDTIVIGAGAAGLMCGAVAGRRGKRVLILDHARAAGEKIRISGGGRCNFTNIYCGPENFLSSNPHFCKSALAGYAPEDFIGLVDGYGIAWHEKTKGQLFCDGSSRQIVSMLLSECQDAGNDLRLSTEVTEINRIDSGFAVSAGETGYRCGSLVIACGGPSIPKMGASGYGYRIAEQFGLPVVEPRPALVPLTFTDSLLEGMKALAGVSAEAAVSNVRARFEDPLLFTHRGLSGPGILQISSYWMPGEAIAIDLVPGVDLLGELRAARQSEGRHPPAKTLARYLPQRLAQWLAEGSPPRLADMNDAALSALVESVTRWAVKPAGTEGFRTAEVTLGGVDTAALSSKTMEVRTIPGLYFIGEVVDVTGHLGGHNFQWAWASGVAAGAAV